VQYQQRGNGEHGDTGKTEFSLRIFKTPSKQEQGLKPFEQKSSKYDNELLHVDIIVGVL
jgi:hypothetical protein